MEKLSELQNFEYLLLLRTKLMHGSILGKAYSLVLLVRKPAKLLFTDSTTRVVIVAANCTCICIVHKWVNAYERVGVRCRVVR